MTKNKNKKSSEAAKQEAFKLSDGICYCKTPEYMVEAVENSDKISSPKKFTLGRIYMENPGQ